MGCCGQKRAALTKASLKKEPSTGYSPTQLDGELRSRGQQTSTQTNPNYPSVSLCYLESSPIVVLRSATGRRYQFSSTNRIQSVDARDSVSLLRTKFFRQIY